MLKHINDGEIKILRDGFYNALALKKINILDSNRYSSKELDLNVAIKIYKLIIDLNFSTCYENNSLIMLEYLFKYNLLEEYDFTKITTMFNNHRYFTEEPCNLEKRYIYIFKFLHKFASKLEVKIHSAQFTDILFNTESIDMSIYRELRNSLMRDLVSYNEFKYCDDKAINEELENAYNELFQEDATSFVLEGYEMNSNQLRFFNSVFPIDDVLIQSGAYTCYGNTYINISNLQVYYEIGFDFFITLVLIFMNKN
ncbi:hypothetical protein OD350_29345 (plasmid) [Clostridium beijerinckii]|uniref:hypothetical protein n=1 Tax=Clostridium beijerinckii TaxID=1520 RepID=UPI0022275D35|nr:hypothetical protein [Clostridium beijerinckii]UYZ38995.1 hypothetical protein OD350_29345 [Clostridium beijerinckii]